MTRFAFTIRDSLGQWLEGLTPPPPQLLKLASDSRAVLLHAAPNPFARRLR